MLKILWKRGEIAPEEQFFPFSTIFCYLMLDFYIKIRIRFALRDKRLFEIIEVEITRVGCSLNKSRHSNPCLDVGILTFISRTNSMLGFSESEKCYIS